MNDILGNQIEDQMWIFYAVKGSIRINYRFAYVLQVNVGSINVIPIIHEPHHSNQWRVAKIATICNTPLIVSRPDIISDEMYLQMQETIRKYNEHS